MKRVFLLLSFLVLCVGLFTSYTGSSASAWTSNPLPQCDARYTDHLANRKDEWQAQMKLLFPSGNTYEYNSQSSLVAYVTQTRLNSDALLGDSHMDKFSYVSVAFAKPGNQIGFKKVGADYQFAEKDANTYIKGEILSRKPYNNTYQDSIYGRVPGYGVHPSPPTTSTAQLDVGCVLFVNKVVYASAWDNITFSTAFPVGENGYVCAKTDIACHIGKVFNGVANTFVAVGDAIVQGIATLFIPDPDYMATSFAELNDFLRDKLGFLYFPADFVVDNMIYLLGSCAGGGCNKTYHSFGNLFGSQVAISTDPSTVNPTIQTAIQTVAQIVVAIGLVFAIVHKYKKIVGGHSDGS